MAINLFLTFSFSMWTLMSFQTFDTAATKMEQQIRTPSPSSVVPESTTVRTITQPLQTSESATEVEIQPTQVKKNEPMNAFWHGELARGLVTLIIGIISFFLSQIYFRYRDKKKDKEEYLSLLSVTAEEVKRNLDSECQIHAYLYVNIMPTFELSFFVPANIFKELTRICDNYDLLKNLYQKYFEYRHIQDRIDRTKKINDHIGTIQISGSTVRQNLQRNFIAERNGTTELIRGNIRGSLELYNFLIQELAKSKRYRLNQLSIKYLDEKFDYFQTCNEVQTAAQQQNINLQERQRYY